jgi:hypothetical protein
MDTRDEALQTKDEARRIAINWRGRRSCWESEIATLDDSWMRRLRGAPAETRGLAVLSVTLPRLWPLSPVGP